MTNPFLCVIINEVVEKKGKLCPERKKTMFTSRYINSFNNRIKTALPCTTDKGHGLACAYKISRFRCIGWRDLP